MRFGAPLDEFARQPMNSEFIRFVLVGGVAALVNIVSRLFLSSLMPFEAAVVIAYLVGMVTAFCLSRQFVFAKSERHVGNEAMRLCLSMWRRFFRCGLLASVSRLGFFQRLGSFGKRS
jgi:putative flippase GtrA